MYNSQIVIRIYPKGIYNINGHWYPEIYIPISQEVTFSEAKQRIVGKTIAYSDWTGAKQWTISNEDFYTDDSPEKYIIPFRKKDCIELRICWKIKSKTIWNFYVDTMNGELVMQEQTVIF